MLKYTSIIFIGDVNQLPSVGAGTLLSDIICCNIFPVAKLTIVQRTSSDSKIAIYSNQINNGHYPSFYSSDKDFHFYKFKWERGDTTVNDDVKNKIKHLLDHEIPALGFNPITDVQILSPMRVNPLGTINLNTEFQDFLNPRDPKCKPLKYGYKEFRNGDKVIQIKNNYDKLVFNGDVGYIVSINTEETQLMVNFDGINVEYEDDDLEQLELAYAITIHKSQGSEYPIVIIPFTSAHFIMLERNLLYTGVTRGKKHVYLLGHEMSVQKAIKTLKSKSRITNLTYRFCEGLDNVCH